MSKSNVPRVVACVSRTRDQELRRVKEPMLSHAHAKAKRLNRSGAVSPISQVRTGGPLLRKLRYSCTQAATANDQLRAWVLKLPHGCCPCGSSEGHHTSKQGHGPDSRVFARSLEEMPVHQSGERDAALLRPHVLPHLITHDPTSHPTHTTHRRQHADRERRCATAGLAAAEAPSAL